MSAADWLSLMFVAFAVGCLVDVWFYASSPRDLRLTGRWPDLLPGSGLMAYWRYRRQRHEYARCQSCRETRRIEFMHLGICPMCRLNEAETLEERAAALRDLGRELGIDDV